MKKDKLYPISIVITTYYRPKLLAKALESIKKLEYPLEKIEIIVVRVPGDTYAEIIINKYRDILDVKLVNSNQDCISCQRNKGIMVSNNDIVILVDDDIELSPCTIKNALELLEKPRVAAVVFPALSKHPSLEEKLHHGKFLGIVSNKIYTTMPVTALRKSLLTKIGLFREDMGPPYSLHEDWEMGSRIRKKGFIIIVDGRCPQRHLLEYRRSKNIPIETNKTNNIILSTILNISRKIIHYFNLYIDKHWWSFWQVMKSSPLSQLVEYAGYYALPVILLSALLTAGIKGFLLSLGIVVAIIDTYSLLMRYYSRLSLLERLTYPLVLVAVRSIRAYLALIGLIHNKLRGREPRQRK